MAIDRKNAKYSPDGKFFLLLNFVDRGLMNRVYCSRCDGLVMSRFDSPAHRPRPITDNDWAEARCGVCDGLDV